MVIIKKTNKIILAMMVKSGGWWGEGRKLYTIGRDVN
jgi:hypothetical protein